MQRFAGQLKADGAFKSVQALRAPDEAATSDYVLLHLQALLAEDDVRALLTSAKGQERARHPHAPSVKALPPDATLLTIVRTGALASKPQRGRPPKGGEADGDFGMQRNWELGGYSVSSMERRSNFDNRRINVSQKETQGDVLAGAGLIISGVPISLAEMRMLKPSQRKVQIGHHTTARLHTAQLDEYHNEEAAEHVRYVFPQFDEGTAGGFSTGVPGLVAGVTGLLPDDCGKYTEPYEDFLGLEILPNKKGRTVAGGLLRILLCRGMTDIYFLGSDAVTSNTGHLSGAIAYLRRDLDRKLIFIVRCMAHICSRTIRVSYAGVLNMSCTYPQRPESSPGDDVAAQGANPRVAVWRGNRC